jgi:peptidoglycan/LPS O-acetylase OafA/YrhL
MKIPEHRTPEHLNFHDGRTTMQSFGDLLNRRANNFDFLRFFMAVLVILQHSFPLLYGMPALQRDPLSRITGGQIGSGSLAVFSFFVISGFLITKSWETSRGTMDYARKRLLRIYPGYLAAILVSVVIVGPLAGSNLRGYIAGGAILRYLGADLTFLVPTKDTLPGGFSTLPVPFHTNGSLWTIRLELMCYAMVALFGLCGLLVSRSRPRVNRAAQCIILLGLLVLFETGFFYLKDRNIEFRVIGNAFEFPYLAPYFLAGILYYVLRNRVRSSPHIFAGAVACFVASVALKVTLITLPLLLPYMLLYIGFAPGLKLHDFGKRGDFSYGMYLYGWPVQQILVQYFGRWLNPWTLCLSACCLTLVIAVLSWHLVEKPFLKFKSRSGVRTEEAEHAAPIIALEPVQKL